MGMVKCRNCGTETSDEKGYCSSCGAVLTAADIIGTAESVLPAVQAVPAAAVKPKKGVKGAAVLGIIVGMAMVAGGIAVMMMDIGFTSLGQVSAASFGGDFYTYIYGATETAADNLYCIGTILNDLADIVKLSAGAILAGMGASLACLSALIGSKT